MNSNYINEKENFHNEKVYPGVEATYNNNVVGAASDVTSKAAIELARKSKTSFVGYMSNLPQMIREGRITIADEDKGKLDNVNYCPFICGLFTTSHPVANMNRVHPAKFATVDYQVMLDTIHYYPVGIIECLKTITKIQDHFTTHFYIKEDERQVLFYPTLSESEQVEYERLDNKVDLSLQEKRRLDNLIEARKDNLRRLLVDSMHKQVQQNVNAGNAI